MVPQCGLESAPVDWGTYALAKAVRDELSVGVANVTFTLHEMKCDSPPTSSEEAGWNADNLKGTDERRHVRGRKHIPALDGPLPH